jgi:hypothetical protein
MSRAEPIQVDNVVTKKMELRIPTKESKSTNGTMYHVVHNKVKLRAIMPTMLAPFGAGTQKENANKYSMAISFEGMDDDTPLGNKLKRAHSKMQQIDDRIRELMMENKELFFKDVKDAAGKKDPKKKGGVLDDNIIQARYNSFLRSKDDMPELMYLAMQTVRIPDKDATKYTEEEKVAMTKRFTGIPNYDFLVDNDLNAIDINTDNISDVLPWGSRIKPVIELSYLWVTKDRCYPVWSFVHGLLVSDGKQNVFDIRRYDDDEDAPRDEDETNERREDDEDAMDEDARDDGDGNEEEEDEEEEEEAK